MYDFALLVHSAFVSVLFGIVMRVLVIRPLLERRAH